MMPQIKCHKRLIKVLLTFVLLPLFSLTLYQGCKSSSQTSESNFEKYRDKINKYLQWADNQGLSGSIVIAEKGKVVMEKFMGNADRENNIPVNSKTIFTIGSITKQFTAAAVLKLEMLGELSTEDLITDYFSNVPDDKKEIKLHHLLTHSGGFPGSIGFDFEDISKEDYKQRAFDRDLEFQPGEGYDYSNVGYSLLAMVIEEVSGKSYEEYLQENLFNPSGMNQTGYLIPDWDDKNFAIGYRKEKRWGSVYEHFKTSGPSWHLKGNGGIHSTAEDMVKWHNALMGNTILSEDAKNKMYTAHVREGNSDVFYGYGYTIRRPYDDQKLLVKHNGGNGIFFADYLRFIDDNLVIFLATNAVDSKFDYFGFEIADIINIKDYMPEMIDYSKIKILDSLPDDLQGERAIKFLEMISSENTETVLKDFIQGNFSEDLIERRGEDQLITILKDLYTRIGQHELIKVEILKETQYKVYLNPDKSPDWYIISFLYEETEKYLIRGLNLDITSPEN